MNNRTSIVLVTIYALFITALIVRNGSVLFLIVPFLLYLMIGIFTAPGDIDIVVNRQIDGISFNSRDPICVCFLVKNNGSSLTNLRIEDTLFPSMKILEGQSHQRISLSAGEEVEINYKFNAVRGVYSWKSVRIVASDPFGLFSLERDFPAPGDILVRPEMMKFHNNPFKPLKTFHTSGQILSRRAGAGTDFFGIREYRAGDSLRHINWQKNARRPHQYFTNEYEREEITDFGVILDTRQLTKYFDRESELFERSISAAASLSERILGNGNRVALLTFGETITSVFPGFGKRQLNRVIRCLVETTMSAYIPFRYLKYISTRLFPSRSMIIVFSTLDSQDLDVYARLCAYGYEILVISPDPVEHTMRSLQKTEMNALAFRAAQIERVILLKRLMKMGIKVVDWKGDESLGIIVKKASRYLSSRKLVSNYK